MSGPTLRALRSIVLFACACASGCTAARVESTAPLWPFERLEIRTRDAGLIAGYLSMPETQPRRLVVVVQTPWCDWWPEGYERIPTVSTSGIVREQLRADSAFLQFERPAIRGAASFPEMGCPAGLVDRFTLNRWARTLGDTLAAVRREKGFEGPVTLISVGLGAVPALMLAHRDASIASVVVLNGYGLDTFESLPQPAGAIVTIVHSEHNAYAPLERVLALVEATRPHPSRVSVIVVRNASFDVGAPETLGCFEELAKLLAQRAIADTDTQARSESQWTCAGAE